MGRAPCCEKIGLKKGRWTAEEDNILTKYIQAYGEGSWRSLPKNAGLLRCGKSCRLRWVNYLKSDLKRGKFSSDEDETIIKLHASLGNRWCLIAGHLPGRTDNEIKNYWNSHLSRRIYHFRKIIQQVQQQKVKVTVDNQPKPKITKTIASKRKGKTSRSAMKKNKSYIPPPPTPNRETVPIPATPALEENLMVLDSNDDIETMDDIFSDSAFTSLVELEAGPADSKLQGNQDNNDIENWLMDAKSEEDHAQGSKVMSSSISDGENSYPNHELDILEWNWGNYLDMNSGMEGKEIWEWESEEEKLMCGLWATT